jgi:hypothetical protein
VTGARGGDPGLELRVRSDAGAVLRRLAQEIHAQYGGKAQDEGTSVEAGSNANAGPAG